MTAAVITLAAALVGCIGFAAWLAHAQSSRVDQLIAAGDMLAKTRELLLDQTMATREARFELASATRALESERARAAALEEYVRSHALDESPDSVLADDDLAGHLLRLSRSWGALSSGPPAGGPLPAVPGDGVRPPGPAEPTDPGR